MVVPQAKKPTNPQQTTTKQRRRVVEERVEAVLLGWSQRMGFRVDDDVWKRRLAWLAHTRKQLRPCHYGWPSLPHCSSPSSHRSRMQQWKGVVGRRSNN
ncbi:unnamed protein product [Musa hybrid cultivar]